MTVSQEKIEKSLQQKTFTYSLWQKIYETRLIDQKMAILVKQNKGTSFLLSTAGHEMVGACAALCLTPKKDWALPYYRDRAFVIGLGCPSQEIIEAFLARDIEHHSGGRMMPDHFSHKEFNIPVRSSVVAGQYLQAVGVALGIQLKGKDEVVYVSGGDGSTSQGDFHEALNFATIHSLPCIFVIQDNGYAISTISQEQTSGASIAKMVSGYHNLYIEEVDGCDPYALKKAFDHAILKARSQKGPSVIVAKVARLNSHTISDDQTKYKTPEEIIEEAKRDPLVILEKLLLGENSITLQELENAKKDIQQKVEIAIEEAEKKPFEKKEDVFKHLFKEPVATPESTLAPGSLMIEAINQTLQDEMQKDPSIIVFGEDVARNKGGVFGVTRHLTQTFGDKRCFNTPLAESTIIGLAIGLAFYGFKPICEIQFSDFAWSGINQLVNELSSLHWRSKGQWSCPVVVRMTTGGYIQGGPYHSQSLEAVFAHVPGLKVVIPSNAFDAHHLLKEAIHDPNPVIFLEPKAIYRQKMNLPIHTHLPIGKARIIKEGKDLTLLTWGKLVYECSFIASKLQEEKNYDIEVIDLRTLNPLDEKTILESVEKTGKVLIVQEGWKNCGFASEVLSRIMEKGFWHLDSPVVRLAAKDVPIGYSQELEKAILPQKEDIEKAICDLIQS
jgi:2-oxoisovalerate dehydrogenase E1 component